MKLIHAIILIHVHNFHIMSRGNNLTAEILYCWLLQSFHHLFHDVPRILGRGRGVWISQMVNEEEALLIQGFVESYVEEKERNGAVSCMLTCEGALIIKNKRKKHCS